MNKGKTRRKTIKIARIAFVFYWICLITLWPLAPILVKPIRAAESTYIVDDIDAQAYEGDASDGAFNSDDGEFTAGDYANIDGDDSNYVSDSSVITAGAYQYHRFDFVINETVGNITQVDITWKGYGTGFAPGTVDSLWVKDDGTWVEKDSDTNVEIPHTLTTQYTSNISNIFSSGHIHIAAQSDISAQGAPFNKASNLYSYYAEVKITYDEGGGGPVPEFTTYGMLLASLGSIAGYFFLQRQWNMAEERRGSWKK